LIIVSGTHGIEGYSGSAVQLHVLDAFKSRLNNTTTLVLVHALNPYGFHHNNRVNHNRVDLNRAFFDTSDAFTTHNPKLDTALDALYPILVPQRPRRAHWIETAAFYGRVIPLVARAKRNGTYPQLKNALAGGQYRYPDAPFYGGQSIQEEVRVFDRILREVTEGHEEALVMDCHTGLGRWGEAVYFSANTQGSDAFERLRRIEPAVTSIVGDGQQSDEVYEAKGSLLQYALRHSRARTTYAFGLDIGTIPNIPMLSRIIAENQVHRYPETPARITQDVHRRFLEAFYPSSPQWRSNTLRLYDDFLRKLFDEFALI